MLVQGVDPNSQDFPFSPGPDVGKTFVVKDVVQMNSWQLKIADVKTPLEQLWLVARYTLVLLSPAQP
jgi:hypothetical protein